MRIQIRNTAGIIFSNRNADLKPARYAREDGVEIVDGEGKYDLGGEVLQLIPPRVPIGGGQVPGESPNLD